MIDFLNGKNEHMQHRSIETFVLNPVTNCFTELICEEKLAQNSEQQYDQTHIEHTPPTIW